MTMPDFDDDYTLRGIDWEPLPAPVHPLTSVLGDIIAHASDLTARYAGMTPPLEVTTAIHHARTLLRRAAEVTP